MKQGQNVNTTRVKSVDMHPASPDATADRHPLEQSLIERCNHDHPLR